MFAGFVGCSAEIPRGDSIPEELVSNGAALVVPSGAAHLEFFVDADDPRDVALTFDDGPEAGAQTLEILDVLARERVKGTFFVNTNNYVDVRASSVGRRTIERIVGEGHEIGSHGVHHVSLASTSTDVDREIRGVFDVVREIAPDGLASRLARAPFGEPYFGPQWRLDQVAPIVARAAVHVGWTIDSKDWVCASRSSPSSCIVENVVAEIDRGRSGIVLLHSPQPATVSALPSLISALRARGKRFVPVEKFVIAKYGQPSRRLFSCRTSDECHGGDVCRSGRCAAASPGGGDPPPTPPPEPGLRAIADAGSVLSPRIRSAQADTGQGIAVFGGRAPWQEIYLRDGAIYDAALDRWRPIPTSNLGARADAVGVFAEGRLFVFGGRNETTRLTSSSSYDPRTERWASIPAMPRVLRCAPQGTFVPSTREIAIFGCAWSAELGRWLPMGFAYSVAGRTWRSIAEPPLVAREGFVFRFVPGATAADGRVVLFGGASPLRDGPNGTARADGAAWDPVRDRWTRLPAAPLAGRYDPIAAVSGSKLYVYGGLSTGAGFAHVDGAIWDAVANAWTPIAPDRLPRAARAMATGFVLDGALHVVAGNEWYGGAVGLLLSDAHVWSPATGTWSVRDLGLAPRRRAFASKPTDRSVIVWGGDSWGNPLNDGRAITR